MPEVIDFYIASSYYKNTMWEATFFQYYNSAKDIFNIDEKDYKKLKTEVIKLLQIKYSLEIISEDPLDFKRIEYYNLILFLNKKRTLSYNCPFNILDYVQFSFNNFPKNSRKIYNCVNLGGRSVLLFIYNNKSCYRGGN